MSLHTQLGGKYPSLSVTNERVVPRSKARSQSVSSRRVSIDDCFTTNEDITSFTTSRVVTYEWLKEKARRELVVIQSGRDSMGERLGFGLRGKVRTILNLSRVSLFKFGKQKDGLYSCGTISHYSHSPSSPNLPHLTHVYRRN